MVAIKHRIKIKGLLVFFVVCLILLLYGCLLKYEDISKNSEYASFLNTCYSLKKDMFIYGINLDRGYGKDIHIYEILPMNMRTKGPEIIIEDILRSGTILEVQSIRQSVNNVLFTGKVIEAVVKATPYLKSANVPIVINLKYIQSSNYTSKIGLRGESPGRAGIE